ncbi:MAG: hypothetical protein VZQ81_04910 [Succiniclasticum sp.]|jgi:hypothetical protein|nr:hypothetical protein [Succiniclasticum sp.]MEE3479345.1 hypothetical protein [Succiniclasticum sp.]
MNFGFFDLTLGQILNLMLYIIAGVLFGVFGSRQSIFCVRRVRALYREHGFGFRMLVSIPFSLLFLLFAFLLFPAWLASHTVIGAIAYYAVLLFFFSKGWKNTDPSIALDKIGEAAEQAPRDMQQKGNVKRHEKGK